MRQLQLFLTRLYKPVIFLLLAALPLCSRAQKAYETVAYSGKLQSKIIEFKLANGYIGASEIRLITPHKSSTILFRPDSGAPDEQNQLTFLSAGKENPGHFTLSNMQDGYDDPPTVIYGRFKEGNKTTTIKLLKRRSD